MWDDNFSTGRNDFKVLKCRQQSAYVKLWTYIRKVKLFHLTDFEMNDIPLTHFFKCLQLSSFVYAQTHSYKQPQFLILESLAVDNCTGKGSIFILYNTGVKKQKDS